MRLPLGAAVDPLSNPQVHAKRTDRDPCAVPQSWRRLAFLLFIAVALVLPFVTDGYTTYRLALVGALAIAILGINLLTGLSGQFSIGHGAFFTIGAYTTSIAMSHGGLSAYNALPLAAVVVVALMGIMFVAGTVRLGPGSSNNMSARAAARLLSCDMRQAQRRAITTGDDHYLEFQTQGSTIVGYRCYRDDGGSGVAVDDLREFPSGLTVTSADNQLNFDFEGAADSAYDVTLAGPDRSMRVQVVPVTGAVKVTEN